MDQTVKEDLQIFCGLIEKYSVFKLGVSDVFKKSLRAERLGLRGLNLSAAL